MIINSPLNYLIENTKIKGFIKINIQNDSNQSMFLIKD